MLLPHPRQLDLLGGSLQLPSDGIILTAPDQLFTAQWLQRDLAWQIRSSNPADVLAVNLQVGNQPPQHYSLHIDEAGILIEGDAAGLFYGVCTLRQLLQVYGQTLPHLHIEDAPDLAVRGVMLDISRDKVPTMPTLFQLIDMLAALKINQLQLYTEHTFAFQNHPAVWRLADPMTPQQILELDAYCAARFIDLVPNQNSLGHMERWLKHPTYHNLAESPDGFVASWGETRVAGTVDPSDPRSLALFQDLYADLLPHFRSQLFNVGCDEPFELGMGKNKAAVEERGGRVYLDWLLKLHPLVTEHGREMQFWGDLILNHPELVPELPSNITVLEWWYEANRDFAHNAAILAGHGIPFYLCPGTSSWNSLVGRTDNALGNLLNAAERGLEYGAAGYLITDWGDLGHWQPLPVSYLGFAYGAAVSWGVAANRDADMVSLLDQFIFRDAAGVMGKLAYDLGNVYKMSGAEYHNGNPIVYALQWSDDKIETDANFPPETLRDILTSIDEILQPLGDHRMDRPDAALIEMEFRQAANLLKHGAKHLLWRQNQQRTWDLLQELESLILTQRDVWLARNRRGGLEDSIRRFDGLRGKYRAGLG